MSNKTAELLLLNNVESLGIVGDVVTVKAGYARNYLIPHGYATIPTEHAKKALAEKRAQVQAHLTQLRKDMEALIEKLDGFEITLQQSCNDHGFLYGSVTQKDIADALYQSGFPQVHERHVRLGTSIKRIDSYMIPIQLDQDLKTEIKLWVVADRELVFEGEENAGEESPDEEQKKKDGEAAPQAETTASNAD